jgi:D-3-phosphoglycerate dehydrogenase
LKDPDHVDATQAATHQRTRHPGSGDGSSDLRETRLKVQICDPVDETAITRLRDRFQVEVRRDVLNTDADVLVVRSRTRITAKVIESAKNLKIIARPGVGVDNIDGEAAAKHGIKVITSPQASTRSVAELTLGLILSLAREIPRADRALRKGRWEKRELKGSEVAGKSLGILGLGKIGDEVARLGRALGMEVIYWSRHRKPDREAAAGIAYVSFKELFKRSDFLSIHVTLTTATRGIIGKRELAWMKRGACLINTARGALIDETALYEALRAGRIRGAGLDVFSEEPYTGPLRGLRTVVLTPHIGANTREAQLRSGTCIADAIITALTER